MVFSVTKSVLSLLVGAAIDDGIIGSVDDAVTDYLPEMSDAGFDGVTLEDLLRMDTDLAYVEDDNPFGIHVEFNYTDDLTGDILALGLRDEPDEVFRYKSGDNAILGLVLHRALGDLSITEYLHERLWEPLGAESGGIWSTDHEDGLERTWCCLAVSAPDLARLGQLAIQEGSWAGKQLIPADWLRASFAPGYDSNRWPADYADSPLESYGYQWWLTDEGARLALGKDGQYLYLDPKRSVVIVRLGDTQGGISWIPILEQVAEAAASTRDLAPAG
jgi:CubicO group peptidase (beta-lactamase class C family)